MDTRATFWLIAGPNGAGKTTSLSSARVRRLVEGVPFLNADDVTLEKIKMAGWSGFASVSGSELKHYFVEAADEVFSAVWKAISDGKSIGTETVLSTSKFQKVVDLVKEVGGAFGFVYVGLASPELSAERVARRVANGGHDVPADRLVARWNRSVQNMGWCAAQADAFFVFDNSNSDADVPPVLIAEGGGGRAVIHEADAIPAITESLLAAFGGEPQVP